MISRNMPWALVALLGLLASAGCAKNPRAPKLDPLRYEDYPHITALEKLRRNVVLCHVHEEPGPPLQVAVQVRNRTHEQERHIQYRFFFLNRGGVPEDPNPDWRYVKLPARTIVFLQGNALDREMVKWRLEMRPAR